MNTSAKHCTLSKEKKLVCLLFYFDFSKIMQVRVRFTLEYRSNAARVILKDVYSSCQSMSCKFLPCRKWKMLWHVECRHQSSVTFSERFSCLDWQVISEDKLRFDLVLTCHNKNTRKRTAEEKKPTTHHISNNIPRFSWYHTALLLKTLTSAC